MGGTVSLPSPRTTSILVIDDDPLVADLIRDSLEHEGYVVGVAETGAEGIDAAVELQPRVILLDVMLPDTDGMTVCRALRGNSRTAVIPIIMLSAMAGPDYKVTSLDVGADDYIVKPFHIPELLARIRTQLRHVTNNYLSDLTGLPTNTLIAQTIRTELERGGDDLSILYIDLDNFKAYNDHPAYGFLAGNELIKLTAAIIRRVVETMGSPGSFIGHVGGDDFVVVTRSPRVEELCQALIAAFDRERDALYTDEDRRQEYIISTNRQGQREQFPLASLSIGVVSTAHRPIADEWEVSHIAADVKKKAKGVPGSAYYIDQRGTF